MTLSAVSLFVEGAFAVVLVVTIVYAVKLNIRISGLRDRDSELREMIEQFDQATNQARDSAQALKSAGIDADRQLRASIDRAQALRDDLAYMIEHGGKIADRIEHAPVHQRPAPGRPPGAAEPGGSPPDPASEPSRASGEDEDRQYRSEIEQALAQVVRSTAAAG